MKRGVATIKAPPKEVLDLIDLLYTYDPNTGLINRKGSKKRKKKNTKDYINADISLGTDSDGIGRVYRTRAHRVAWYITYHVWPDKLIDHIDGDPTNNRLDNLRLATHLENDRNRRKVVKRNTTSKYKGVIASKNGKVWRALIKPARNEALAIGNYATEEDAALAYDLAAIELFGEFARLNFPSSRQCTVLPEKVAPARYIPYKLTGEQVIEILRLRKEENLSYIKLGKMFNVCDTTIFRIVKKQSWKHIP